MKERALAEQLLGAAEEYLIALIRESMSSGVAQPPGRRSPETISARFRLLNLAEQLELAGANEEAKHHGRSET